MHNKDVIRGINQAIMLSIAALTLGGCLSQEEASSFVKTSAEPVGNSAPEIFGDPRTVVKIGDMYSFTPRASDADADTLTFSIRNRPNWANFDNTTGSLSGQPTLGDIGVFDGIVISVTDGTHKVALDEFAIRVNQVSTGSATLNLIAPTLNEDGTALTDLAGYKLYWGTTSGQYTNSLTISDPGISTYVVENLTAGMYEFVATSYNAAGVESRHSNPVTRVVN